MSDLGSGGEGPRMEPSRDQQGLKNRVPAEAELSRKEDKETHSEGAGENYESDPQGMATPYSALFSLEIDQRTRPLS